MISPVSVVSKPVNWSELRARAAREVTAQDCFEVVTSSSVPPDTVLLTAVHAHPREGHEGTVAVRATVALGILPLRSKVPV